MSQVGIQGVELLLRDRRKGKTELGGWSGCTHRPRIQPFSVNPNFLSFRATVDCCTPKA